MFWTWALHRARITHHTYLRLPPRLFCTHCHHYHLVTDGSAGQFHYGFPGYGVMIWFTFILSIYPAFWLRVCALHSHTPSAHCPIPPWFPTPPACPLHLPPHPPLVWRCPYPPASISYHTAFPHTPPPTPPFYQFPHTPRYSVPHPSHLHVALPACPQVSQDCNCCHMPRTPFPACLPHYTFVATFVAVAQPGITRC